MAVTEFDIGNVYSKKGEDEDEKTYYIAVSKLTLVTCCDKKFGEFTTKRTKEHEYESVSVDDLCFMWEIEASNLDDFMIKYFAPDEQAKRDARKRAKEEDVESLEMELSSTL